MKSNKKRLPKNFNFEKGYFELMEQFNMKEKEHKFLLETVGQLSSEKEDLQVNSQLLVIANNQSIDRLNALTDERPEAEKVDNLTRMLQERDFVIQEHEIKKIQDGEEITKLQKEIGICRNTIDLIKGQSKGREAELLTKDARIADLEEQLEEYKRNSLIRLRESNNKTLGLSITLQHLVKSHDETLAKKDVRMAQLKNVNEELSTLKTALTKENGVLKETNTELEHKISELNRVNRNCNIEITDNLETIDILKNDVVRYKNKTFGRRVKRLFSCRGSRAEKAEYSNRPLNKSGADSVPVSSGKDPCTIQTIASTAGVTTEKASQSGCVKSKDPIKKKTDVSADNKGGNGCVDAKLTDKIDNNVKQPAEASGPEAKLPAETSGNNDNKSAEMSGPNDRQSTQGSGPGDKKSSKTSGPGDKQSAKTSGPDDRQSAEASGPNDKESVKTSGPNDGQSAEASGLNNRQSAAASGPNDRQSAEASGPNDRQSAEASGPNDRQSAEASGLNNRQSAEASGPNDKQSAETSGTDTKHSVEVSDTTVDISINAACTDANKLAEVIGGEIYKASGTDTDEQVEPDVASSRQSQTETTGPSETVSESETSTTDTETINKKNLDPCTQPTSVKNAIALFERNSVVGEFGESTGIDDRADPGSDGQAVLQPPDV
ncbi:Duffy receptor-like [Clytia hemisphaerica]